MFKPSQETIAIVIAIVTVGVALGGLDFMSYNALITSHNGLITNYNGLRSDMQALRDEARADREAWEAESIRLRADREAWQAEASALRTQAGVDRETIGRLTGIVEEVRTARR